MSVRKRSIMQLGLACNFDEEHAHTVNRLALELFDSIQALGIYNFREGERELLEYGSTLHDIEIFLSCVLDFVLQTHKSYIKQDFGTLLFLHENLKSKDIRKCLGLKVL